MFIMLHFCFNVCLNKHANKLFIKVYMEKYNVFLFCFDVFTLTIEPLCLPNNSCFIAELVHLAGPSGFP